MKYICRQVHPTGCGPVAIYNVFKYFNYGPATLKQIQAQCAGFSDFPEDGIHLHKLSKILKSLGLKYRRIKRVNYRQLTAGLSRYGIVILAFSYMRDKKRRFHYATLIYNDKKKTLTFLNTKQGTIQELKTCLRDSWYNTWHYPQAWFIREPK